MPYLLLSWSSVLNLFHTINIRGRELYLCDIIKYTFNIVLRHHSWEPIYFKLGMMLDTANLYSVIPVWITQGHNGMGKLEPVQSFCCKVAWSSPNVRDGWLCTRYDFNFFFFFFFKKRKGPVSLANMDRLSSCCSCFDGSGLTICTRQPYTVVYRPTMLRSVRDECAKKLWHTEGGERRFFFLMGHDGCLQPHPSFFFFFFFFFCANFALFLMRDYSSEQTL